MGIIINQSLRNSISSYLGIAIGALNTLVLATQAFKSNPEFYGLIQIILSSTLVISTFANFGAPNIVLKFFPALEAIKTKKLFGFSLLLPIPLILLFIVSAIFFKDSISIWLTSNQEDAALLGEYFFYLIPLVFFNIYFEIFASISSAYLRSVVPLFLKEVERRLVTTLLMVLFWFGVIDFQWFIILFTLSFFSQFLIIAFSLLSRRQLSFNFSFSGLRMREIIDYGFFGILTYGGVLLINRLDMIMIGKLMDLPNVAYYTIGFFIGAVISTPGKASAGIVKPILSKAMELGRIQEIQTLYIKSCITLLLVSGWIFMVVWINIDEIYALIPEQFSGGEWVVFYIGLGRLINMGSGINGHIILMSKYYRFNLWSNILLIVLTIVVNYWLIPIYGITGAAMATAITMALDQVIRIVYVYYRFKIQPFNLKYLSAVLILALHIVLFGLVKLSLPEFWAIAVKGIMSSIVFVAVVYLGKFSPEINELLERWGKKLVRR